MGDSKCPVVDEISIVDQREIVAVAVISADSSFRIFRTPVAHHLATEPCRNLNSRITTPKTVTTALERPSSLHIIVLLLTAKNANKTAQPNRRLTWILTVHSSLENKSSGSVRFEDVGNLEKQIALILVFEPVFTTQAEFF